MTKAEFLDQLAGDERIGSKKAAGDAVDAVLEAITDALSGGGEVSFTGFGKFHVAERGPRRASTRAPASGSRSRAAKCRASPPAPRSRPKSRAAEAERLSRIGLRRSSTSAAARSASVSIPTRRSWPGTGRGRPSRRRAAELAAAAVAAHCRALIERAGPACVAVKPQLACFERLGAPGWAALAEDLRAAREAGLLVIADGKRGDVPVTAAAYAQALVGETPTPWGPVPGLGADAFTANPLLGARRARAAGRCRRGGRRRRSSPWSAPATRAPPTSQDLPAPERAAARAPGGAGRRARRAAARATAG